MINIPTADDSNSNRNINLMNHFGNEAKIMIDKLSPFTLTITDAQYHHP